MDSNGVIFQTEEGKNNPITESLLSAGGQKLVENYQRVLDHLKPRGEIATVHVDEIASKVALLYEKVRKIIDWKEEHLIRRGAIERVLKRRLISEMSRQKLIPIPNVDPHKAAEPMVLELIRGGHFTNDKIPQAKIGEVEKVLRKYIYILENNPLYGSANIKDKINLYNWLLEVAASEIEDTLEPPLKENLLINFMTETILEGIRVAPGTDLSEEEKRLQTYIAVHRALFHLDAPLISYHLIKYRYFPNWTNMEEAQLEKITKNITDLRKRIEDDLAHPFSSHFQKICEKYDTVYLILGDILEKLSDHPETISETFSDPALLEPQVKKSYDERLSTLKSRLTRAAIYSTLSIFVAGAFSLFVIEVPLAKLFYGKFSPLAVLVDILIPTAVMFLLVIIIKPPGEENFTRVVKETNKIVYKSEEKDIYEIKARKKKGWIISLTIGLLYALTSLISMALVFWIFQIARVPVTSLYIDTLNVAMIVFAALIIRQRAKEMIIEEKTSFSQFFLDVLSIPVAKLGQWLSVKWKEYNIVSVFFTAIVDIPFLTITEFIESWSNFLKEKKAEIR
ncbi:MAG: hypothetical protein ABH867_00190 [Patescibacteria group bacterium]|nr:hypothetical protein [Patescibacteria group bacterium]